MLKHSIIDRLLISLDAALRPKKEVDSTYPASDMESDCNEVSSYKNDSIKMLRVNHTGEICAQALYHGQALFARNSMQYCSLMSAASEEQDHLLWCKYRLNELGGKTSYFNPLWYMGSLAIGSLASLTGDKISLGFLAETEYQVCEHLDKHLNKISPLDKRSRAILAQMRIDELKHATGAINNGGVELPNPIKITMRFCARVMTTVAAKI